jgi:hypothetical protein
MRLQSICFIKFDIQETNNIVCLFLFFRGLKRGLQLFVHDASSFATHFRDKGSKTRLSGQYLNSNSNINVIFNKDTLL